MAGPVVPAIVISGQKRKASRAMVRKIVTAVIVIPLAIVIIAFAVANRQGVTVSFDPFNSANPAASVTLPLFIIIFILVILGVVVGGIAAWLRQSSWRRAARRLDGEVRQLREETARLNAMLNAQTESPRESGPAPSGTMPLLQQRMHQ
jgi:uncharacterized integral membrane protein